MKSLDYIHVMMPEAPKSVALLNDEIVGACHVAIAGENGSVVVYVDPSIIRFEHSSFIEIFYGKVEIYTADSMDESPIETMMARGKRHFDAREELKHRKDSRILS